jgi:Zn-dependent alcohol dehydrogenase
MRLDKLLTHEYLLEDINQSFDDLDNGIIGRAIINYSSHSSGNN